MSTATTNRRTKSKKEARKSTRQIKLDHAGLSGFIKTGVDSYGVFGALARGVHHDLLDAPMSDESEMTLLALIGGLSVMEWILRDALDVLDQIS